MGDVEKYFEHLSDAHTLAADSLTKAHEAAGTGYYDKAQVYAAIAQAFYAEMMALSLMRLVALGEHNADNDRAERPSGPVAS